MDTHPEHLRVLFCAGGTAGHVNPAEALAERLASLHHRPYLLTDSRGMRFVRSKAWVNVETIVSGTPLKHGAFSRMFSTIHLGLGCAQALYYLWRLRPHRVVGFGGYPSVPPVFVAQRLGIPTVLHEQNSVMGRANVFLSRRAKAVVYGSAPNDQLPHMGKNRYFIPTPLRRDVLAFSNEPYPSHTLDTAFRLLVIGGSQGAHIFGEIVPQAIAKLPPAIRGKLHLVQQIKHEQLERISQCYSGLGLASFILADFFEDLPERLAQSHLVISRSGALSVSEIAAIGRPSILIPFPNSHDSEQLYNAHKLEESGAALVIEEKNLDDDQFASSLLTLLRDKEKLKAMALQSKRCAPDDPVQQLANIVLTL